MSKKRNKKPRPSGPIRKPKNLERILKTVPTPPDLDMREQAKKVALEIRQTHSSVERILWFPDNSELRIIEIDGNTIKSPTTEIEPFYFDPTASLPVPSGIAIIRPDEYGELLLPEGWGDWSDGLEVEVSITQ